MNKAIFAIILCIPLLFSPQRKTQFALSDEQLTLKMAQENKDIKDVFDTIEVLIAETSNATIILCYEAIDNDIKRREMGNLRKLTYKRIGYSRCEMIINEWNR